MSNLVANLMANRSMATSHVTFETRKNTSTYFLVVAPISPLLQMMYITRTYPTFSPSSSLSAFSLSLLCCYRGFFPSFLPPYSSLLGWLTTRLYLILMLLRLSFRHIISDGFLSQFLYAALSGYLTLLV